MKVGELIKLLQEQADPEAEVRVAVGWAADTAYSDLGEEVTLQWLEESGVTAVTLTGYMSDCGTEL